MRKMAVQPEEKVNVLGVGVHPIDMQGGLLTLLESRIKEKAKGYRVPYQEVHAE